jgi:alpha-N-arabinofuranosidase
MGSPRAGLVTTGTVIATFFLGLASPAAYGAATPAGPSPATAESGRGRITTITVDWRHPRTAVHDQVLGVNMDYFHDGRGIWDAKRNRPVLRVVKRLHRTSVRMIRYPGGIAGNLFDWKKAVGRHPGCQIDGRVADDGFQAFTSGLGYGPDENEQLARAAGSKVAIMVPFITGTPADAADWVEYMNAPANRPGNPNGGVDWAQRRADNGHPGAYHVQRWEVGNEQRNFKQRYWMSPERPLALSQYVHGASPRIALEPVGKECSHPFRGVPSDGSANQVFDVLYPPMSPTGVIVKIRGERWTRTSDLATAGRNAQVYKVLPSSGHIVFGDGRHGAIPPRGAVVRTSYTSVHAGVFSIMRAMHAVDPSIQTCVSWGLRTFVQEARGHPYDCFTAHAYTHFKRLDHTHWANALEGHDRHMLGADSERRIVGALQRSLPGRTRLPLTEFGSLWGDNSTYPTWPASMTRALYMATGWVNWLELNLPWTTGGVLSTGNLRGLLGPGSDFTLSAEAVARTAVAPLFKAGGHLLRVIVRRNPVRTPHLSAKERSYYGAGSYNALKVAATHSRDGNLYLLVVNRLPLKNEAVTTRVLLHGFTSRGKAGLRRVTGASFRSWNRPGHQPGVVLVRQNRSIGHTQFRQTFPPHSITLLRIGPQR